MGGVADVHSGQSPLKPLPGFDLRPSDRVFRYSMPIDPQSRGDGIWRFALARPLDYRRGRSDGVPQTAAEALMPSKTLSPLRIKPRLHLLSGPKERNGLSSDENQRPCPGILASASFPELYKKTSKPPQFDPVTASHCSGNLCKNGADDLLAISPIETRVLDG